MNGRYMDWVNYQAGQEEARRVARASNEDMTMKQLRQLLMRYGYNSEKSPIERQREKYNNGKALKCKFE